MGDGVKKLAVLAMAGLMSVTASASNWVQIHNDDTTTTYIDTDSIASSGGYKQLFMKGDFYNLQTGPDGKRYDQIVSLVQIDCKSQPKRNRHLSILFRIGNKQVDSIYTASQWYFIYPDSVGEAIVKRVCPYQK